MLDDCLDNQWKDEWFHRQSELVCSYHRLQECFCFDYRVHTQAGFLDNLKAGSDHRYYKRVCCPDIQESEVVHRVHTRVDCLDTPFLVHLI
jgi:hypothetical protein